MYGIIYKITNQLDGKPYVGQTVRTLEERFQEHAKADTYIGNAIRAHGVENFTCEVIEECDTREQLNEREIFWIAELNCKAPNGYNLTDGGEGTSGLEFTPEHCAKISAAKKNPSAETRAKMSAVHKGKPLSDEHRAKIGATQKGKKLSEETKAKIGAKHKGVPKSPEHKAKLAAANTGKKASAETKAKMSAKRKGKRHTQEARAKIAAAKTDKPRSKETVRKMSIGRRGESLYKNLLAEMDARQITYSALAKLLGFKSYTSISNKMRGKENFTAEQIAKLVEIFDKPAEYLISGSVRWIV